MNTAGMQGISSSCIALMRRAKTLICFRNFREIVSAHEFVSIGEEMEKQEVQKFGEDGFEWPPALRKLNRRSASLT